MNIELNPNNFPTYFNLNMIIRPLDIQHSGHKYGYL